ncbi:conserved unknown protein [Ectocarpus siliculosus]|uniref:PPM-type phosphatase domain-containing protein n=1 Tax=Ectocarpus siliculosus TaxID=2880 RepID=D8LIW0_ECTSI|nr:conserved unknown protein [Ectocarpus siliculosus]|eukprot:CBN76844.1 conserved unknown protein [Ectocarpus siliculosus]
MSVDHKPGRKAESRRILRSGGYLDETDPRNPRVVCDTLKMSIATSRALGDFDFKSNPSRLPEEQMVSPVPELYTRRRDPQDEFLILATDGVWDVMDNPGIVSFLQIQAACLARGDEIYGETGDTGETDSELLARSVLKRCLDLGSRDNMTIVLADLRRRRRRARPKVSPPKLSPTIGEGRGGVEDRGGVAAAAIGAPLLGNRGGTEAVPTVAAAAVPAAVVGASTATAVATAAAAVAPAAAATTTAGAGDKGDFGPSMRVSGGDSSVGGSAVSVSTGGGDPAVHGSVAAAAAEAGVGTREALRQNAGGDGVGAGDGSFLAGHVGDGRDGSSRTRPGQSAGVSGLTAGGGGANNTSKIAVEPGGVAVSGVVGVSGKTSTGGAAAVVEGDGVGEALTVREAGGLLRPPEAVDGNQER